LGVRRCYHTTTFGEAIAMAKRMGREEGIFCSISSGSNLAACLKFAKKHPEVEMIVTMINDTGQRYFSTELCGQPKHVEVPECDHEPDERTQTEREKYRPRWEIIE
jgi:hypothetical protein